MSPAYPGGAAADALRIFCAAVAKVEPAALVRNALRIESSGGSEFLVAEAGSDRARYDLADFDRILVVAFGKASVAMARGLEEVLGDRVADGVAVVKRGCADRLTRIRVLEASHPVPDASSEAAAAAVLALSRGRAGEGLDARSLVVALVSGGGSSLLCAPARGVSLADKAAVTTLLLGSGATIHEANCLRKHLSAVKGGRLAAAFAPATLLSLVLSDVVGDDLDTIASGPTVPDPTSWSDALAVVSRRGIEGRLPPAVLELLRGGVAGAARDTPKPGDPVFARARTLLVGTNRLALGAAEMEARRLGYASLVLSSRLTGEAREVALAFLGIGKDIAASGFPLKRPACLIAGGETTVTLRGGGSGGRNQEMALAFLAAMARSPKDAEELLFLSASTDGVDGPTDAAGAIAHAGLLERAREGGLDPEAYLADNDSYGFFDRVGTLVKTGPTNTNVCDLQLLLVR